MPTVITSLRNFNAYIRGGQGNTPGALKKYMQYYDTHLEQFNKDFYSKSTKQAEIRNELKHILEGLNIPPSDWTAYFEKDTSVYAFLLRLKIEGHYQVNYLIDLIDEKTSWATEKLILNCIVMGIFMVGTVSQPALAGMLGLTSTSGFAIANLYENQFDKKKTASDRSRDGSFIFMNALTNALAYSVWAATKMSPLVGSLFVAASIINVVKELYCMAELHADYDELPFISASISVDDKNSYQTKLRHQYGYLQHRNALLINITISIILVGVMAAWCFLPGGLMLTIGATIASIMLAALKSFLNKKNESLVRECLQDELCKLEVLFSGEIGDINLANTYTIVVPMEDDKGDNYSKQSLKPFTFFNGFFDKPEDDDCLGLDVVCR